MSNAVSIAAVKSRIDTVLEELLAHDGFGSFEVEVRLLKRRQKEVILHYGRQFRFVVDFVCDAPDDVRS